MPVESGDLEKQVRCRTLLIQLLMEWELRPGSEVTNIMFCIYIICIQGCIQEIFLAHPPREAGQRRTRGALRALHIPLTGALGGGWHAKEGLIYEMILYDVGKKMKNKMLNNN